MSMSVPPEDAVRSTDIQALCYQLGARLRGGSHLILYGPRGAGKSSLVGELGVQCRAIGISCGVAPRTIGLPDIVSALAEAYPGTDIAGMGRKAARVHLRLVADALPGVLLLDHATRMTTAMLGYLRRLRGGIAGTLLVVDVDSPRERERLRDLNAGALSIRMPLMPNRDLHQVLLAATHDLPEIESRTLRQIVRMARGRIGWIRECARRLQMQEYWRDDRLHLAVLCMDIEMALREGRSGPRVAHRRGEALWTLQRKCCW
jgi:hypothetical protein